MTDDLNVVRSLVLSEAQLQQTVREQQELIRMLVACMATNSGNKKTPTKRISIPKAIVSHEKLAEITVRPSMSEGAIHFDVTVREDLPES